MQARVDKDVAITQAREDLFAAQRPKEVDAFIDVQGTGQRPESFFVGSSPDDQVLPIRQAGSGKGAESPMEPLQGQEPTDADKSIRAIRRSVIGRQAEEFLA